MSTLGNWNFPGGHKKIATNESIKMTSVCEPGGRSQSTNSFEADIKYKTIRCNRQKWCWAKGMVHQRMFSRWKKVLVGIKKWTKRDADNDKRASMTMNEGEQSSHIPLYGTSLGFSETFRSTWRNICRVRAEYVLSMRKMGTRLWASFPWGGSYNRRTHPGECLTINTIVFSGVRTFAKYSGMTFCDDVMIFLWWLMI